MHRHFGGDVSQRADRGVSGLFDPIIKRAIAIPEMVQTAQRTQNKFQFIIP
jgi:hypothetical protein